MTARHAALSARLLARFGGSATLARTSGADESTYPPTPGTTTNYTVQLIQTGAEVETRAGGLVEAGDLVAAMLPDDEVTPQIGDKLTADGETFTVLAVEAIRSDPAGPVLHWRMEGRR